MKIFIIYFTMGGRTKKTAEAIASVLKNNDVSYFPIELKGRLLKKIKQLDKFENNDFSAIEMELNNLDAASYDLIIIGMPTYGDKPPKIFDKVIDSMKNFSRKRVIVFNTARFTGKKSLDYMKTKVEEKGAQVIDQARFRKLLWIGVKDAVKFGKLINEK